MLNMLVLAIATTMWQAGTIRDLGEPVTTITCWSKGLIERPAGIGGYDLWAVTYNPAGADCVRYDPDTGETKTWTLQGTTEIWPMLRGGDGSIYMGGRGPMLYRINAKTDELDILGPSPTRSFVRALAAGSDGKIYGGGIRSDKIWRFDPSSGQFENLGSLGTGVSYVASMLGTPDGHVFVGMGMPARLAIFDIASGQSTQVLPAKYFDDSFVYNLYLGKGYVYAFLWPSHRVVVYTSSGQFVREISAPQGKPQYHIVLVDGHGRLWLSRADQPTLTVYDPRSDSFAARHPNSLPRTRPPITISDDGTIVHKTFDGQILRVVTAPVRRTKESIFALGVGPDGRVYTDGFQILHLCVTDPASGESRDLGKLDIHASGETYSYNADDKYLYIAKYTHGGVYRYDPTKPYKPTRDAPDSNPRLLCEFGMPCYRPAYNCWGPDGKLWFAGVAGWGWPGWGVAWVDPRTGEHGETHMPKHSFSGIAPLPPERVAVAAGNFLLLWNTKTKKQEASIPMPANRVATDGDGILWVAAGDTVQAFIWRDGLVKLGSWKCAEGAIRELATSPEGAVYGLAGNALVALPSEGGPPRKIADCPAGAAHLAPAADGKFYFSLGRHLYELTVQ